MVRAIMLRPATILLWILAASTSWSAQGDLFQSLSPSFRSFLAGKRGAQEILTNAFAAIPPERKGRIAYYYSDSRKQAGRAFTYSEDNRQVKEMCLIRENDSHVDQLLALLTWTQAQKSPDPYEKIYGEVRSNVITQTEFVQKMAAAELTMVLAVRQWVGGLDLSTKELSDSLDWQFYLDCPDNVQAYLATRSAARGLQLGKIYDQLRQPSVPPSKTSRPAAP
jgi:hypothetical protein